MTARGSRELRARFSHIRRQVMDKLAQHPYWIGPRYRARGSGRRKQAYEAVLRHIVTPGPEVMILPVT